MGFSDMLSYQLCRLCLVVQYCELVGSINWRDRAGSPDSIRPLLSLPFSKFGSDPRKFRQVGFFRPKLQKNGKDVANLSKGGHRKATRNGIYFIPAL